MNSRYKDKLVGVYAPGNYGHTSVLDQTQEFSRWLWSSYAVAMKEHEMSWAVSVFENGKLYQRIQYKDKNKALNEFHRQGAKYGGSKCHEVELKEISNG